MISEEIRQSSCYSAKGEKKVEWATEMAAQFVAQNDFDKSGVPRYVYRCEECGKWHTTKVKR